jgi:Fe-S-cluster-containing hydrogenase component 2
MGNEFAGSKTPLTRVIPIEKTVSPNVEVMPYEELSKMLDGAQTFSMAQCACRVSLGVCDHPHDVCLIFDKTAEFLMERGFAQKISRDQAEEILYRAEEVGLVHTTNNSQDRLNFVCNCCPCCCTILRGATQLQNPNAFLKSRWYAKVEPDQCVGCGVFDDGRCPVDAVKEVEDIARVNSGQCIGCGLCATTCEEDSIKMSFRGLEDQEPPATVSEMGLKVAVEKGKMDDFLKLMER